MLDRVYALMSLHRAARRPSIAFYTQVLGADKMEEWRTCRLEAEGIKKLRTLGA